MILDTNSLSAMAEGEPEAVELVACAVEIALPVVVLGEYLYGIQLSRHRVRYEVWLERVTARSRILVVDTNTADEYARLRLELRRKGRPIPGNDMWIAALARQHNLPLMSRDRHFDEVQGLARIGWQVSRGR